MEFLPHARRYVALGWKVFPVAAGAKVPAIPSKEGGRGVLDATMDLELIERWAQRYPNANVGIACGKDSGILVLDIDIGNGGLQSIRSLQAAGKQFPSTVMARTANGGWHAYFAYTPGPNNSKSRLGRGLDIRTSGGYVLAPPSELDGGKIYRWLRQPLGRFLVPFPGWAVQALKPREETPFYTERVGIPGDIEPLVKKVLELGNGERNSILYWAAYRGAEMSSRGEVSPSAVTNALRGAAHQQGLSLKEADKTIGSAFNRVFGRR